MPRVSPTPKGNVLLASHPLRPFEKPRIIPSEVEGRATSTDVDRQRLQLRNSAFVIRYRFCRGAPYVVDRQGLPARNAPCLTVGQEASCTLSRTSGRAFRSRA